MNRKISILLSVFIITVAVSASFFKENHFVNGLRNVASVSMSNPNSVFLRTPGTGFCKITNATNATPIRITVSNINDCGIGSNGQIVIINEVRGNTSANIHLENSSDRANLARQVYNISGNSFDIKDLNDQPVSGNGTYINGGRVGLATLYTLKSHPRVFLDGQNGNITKSISDKSSGGRANPSSVTYKSLKNSVDLFNSTYNNTWGSDRYGNMTVASALRWLSDGDVNSKNSALFGLNNITQILGTPACDETQRYCYAPASSVADYPTQFSESFMQAYSIMRGQMSQSERENLLNFVLNDLPWTEGGQGYTGVSKTKTQFKVSDKNTSGTIATKSGSNTVTGTGTKFLQTASVGDIITIPHSTENVYANGYKITSVNSDTSITISPPIYENYNSAHYMIGPSWDNTKYGLLWFSKHYEISMLCGGAGDLLTGTLTNPYSDCTSSYGISDGIYQTAGDNNLWLSRLYGYYIIGLATCGDDPRGCLLLSLANELFTNIALPRSMTIWTGFSQSNPGYHTGRMYNTITGIGIATKNSFVEEPDYLSGTDIYEKGALWGIASVMQSNTTLGGDSHIPNSEQGTYYLNANTMRAPLLSMFSVPNSKEARQLKDWLLNKFNYNESFIRYNKGEYVWWHFLWNDPAISTISSPTTFLFNKTNYERCVQIYGIAKCISDEGRYFAVSNQNWTPDRTYIGLNAISSKCLDHCSNDEAGGWFIITKKDKVLYAGDSNNLMSDRSKRPYLEIGSVSNMKSYPETGGVLVNYMAGDDNFMSANIDIKGLYKSSANVSFANKQVFHLKSGSQDYIIDYVKVNTNTQTSLKGIQMYYLNGCGTPSSSPCISLSRSNLTASNNQSNVKLLSRFIGIDTNIALQTENNSDINGSYQGGAGKAFKFYVCPASSGNCTNSNSLEYVAIHKPSLNSNDTLPIMSISSSGSFKVLEIKDSASPKVLVFGQGLALSIPASFETSYSGNAQLTVSGIKSGVYKILSDGKEVFGCLAITVNNGENSLNCNSVPSGTITITESSNPNPVQPKVSLSINSVTSSNIGTSSVSISWDTNRNSNSKVEYGKTTSYENQTPIYDNQIMKLNHSINILNLLSDTTYNFRVISGDSSGNYSTSTNNTFKTLAVLNEAPKVYAGDNKVIKLSDSLFTEASASDDGIPNPLTYSWSVDGNEEIYFAYPKSLNTEIKFPKVGVYKLFLDVSDGAITSRDYVIINVIENPDTVTSNKNNDEDISNNTTTNTNNNQNQNNQNQSQNSSVLNEDNSTGNQNQSNQNQSEDNQVQNQNNNTTQGNQNSSQNQNQNQSANNNQSSTSGQSQNSSSGGGGSPSSVGGGSEYLFSKDTNNVFTSNFNSDSQSANKKSQVLSGANTAISPIQTVSNKSNTEPVKKTVSNTTPLNNSSIVSNMALGKKNSDVLLLQTVLNKQGVLAESSKTGYFGNNTLDALKQFQLKNNLATKNSSNYGKVDSITKNKIEELAKFYSISKNIQSSSVSKIERELKIDSEGEDVKNLQKVLVKEGFLKNSNVTGYFGKTTENAVKKFQVRYRLLPSNTKSKAYGTVGPATRDLVNEKLGSI